MKNQKNKSIKLCFYLPVSFVFTQVIFAEVGDVPVKRDFLNLPHGKWIWLKKVGWDTTKIMVGHGAKKDKNSLWTHVYDTNAERSWAYAYFIPLKRNKFIADLDGDGLFEVGISTYEYGNNMIRTIMIFTLNKSNQLKFIKNVDNYNIAADEPVYN